VRLRTLAVFASLSVAAVSATAQSVDLTGAGATFPYPLYSKWFSDYATKAGVRINYQSIGSGGGIRQLSEQTVDFGASDAPMSDAELSKAKGGKVLHFPMVLGAVVVTYNLPEVQKALKLSGVVLGDVFLGKITKWNDPRIAALNPGVKLPAKDILVVHRSDGSGTTFIFTDYLSAAAPAWKAGPGTGKEVRWPVGLGGKGNEGVAGQVRQIVGAIGYVELAYARQNKLAYAEVQNAAGAFVAPTTEAITEAAAVAAKKLEKDTDYRVSIVNAPGKKAYPIASFTWLLVYEKMPNAGKAKKLVDFMKYAFSDGQKSAAALDYAPLPAGLARQLEKRAATLAATK